MREVRVDIKCLDGPIHLGYSGEYGVTKIYFDLSKIIQEFGNGEWTLMHTRHGDTTPYVVRRATMEGTDLVWPILADDTACVGNGKAELRLQRDNQILLKFPAMATYVHRSVSDVGPIRPTDQIWVDEVQEALNKIRDFIPTNDYMDLDNKPKINGVEIVGNKTDYELDIRPLSNIDIMKLLN